MRRIIYFLAKYYLNDNYKNVSNIALYVKFKGNPKFYLIVVLISLTTFSIPNNNNFGIGATAIIPNQNYLEDIDHYIKSENTGKNYSLKIELPNPYELENDYPVVFVLNFLTFNRFGNVFDIGLYGFYPEWNNDNMVEDVIWVSILEVDFNTDSWLDDTIYDPEPFFSFLEDELVPFLQENYPIDDDQIYLSGAYYGGFFTLWAFFNYPESIIKHFISSEGNFDVDPEKLYNLEQSYFEYNEQNVVLNRTLFLGVGLQTSSRYLNIAPTMYNLILRGYQNQNIIFFDYEEDVGLWTILIDGWWITIHEVFILRFTTTMEINYNLGEISEYGFFANQTIEFIFTGSLWFYDFNLEWKINDTVIGTGIKSEYVFTEIGFQNVTLDIHFGENETYSIVKTYELRIPPEPPFNFHTVVSTSLNSEPYKTVETIEQDLTFNFRIISLVLIFSSYFIRSKRRSRKVEN